MEQAGPFNKKSGSQKQMTNRQTCDTGIDRHRQHPWINSQVSLLTWANKQGYFKNGLYKLEARLLHAICLQVYLNVPGRDIKQDSRQHTMCWSGTCLVLIRKAACV